MARRRKSRAPKDPYSERESKKYDNPIPSREFIMETLQREGCPLNHGDIAGHLALEGEKAEALEFRLKAMVRDGQLIRNRKGGYCVVDSKELIAGRVQGHKDGFGFLIPDESGEDLFLLPREMRQVMHGDRVVVRVSGIDQKGRREGTIVEVLERAHERIVGKLHIEGEVGFVDPDNRRITHEIVVPGSELGDASEGDIVVVELMVQPSRRTQAVGRIVEVIGAYLAAGMETDVAIRSHDIPVEWPEEVLSQIEAFTDEVPEKQKEGRTDLRHLPLVTIDGEDARDFDDAVYCQPTPKGWKLIVAIADVSAYVEPRSPLDVEGRNRGNSVYFPDRVVPMLPEVLSNGLCSLNPKVDRLCMVAEVYIDRQGKITRSRFYEGVMHSRARLTYNKVAKILVDGDEALRKEYRKVVPHLENLHALFNVLEESRRQRGAIDFDTTETRIIFDDNGKIDDIVPVQRNDAHRIIEECMLAANVAAARFFERRKMPAIYRIHDLPQMEKLEDLRAFLGELGLSLKGGEKPTASDYSELLTHVKGRPDAELIQTVLLRSMSQAVYSTENVGHFGLAYPAYTHFTSPIRRYPDLLVHRAIKHLVNGGKPKDFIYGIADLQAMAEHCSATSRRADEATRDAMDTLKAEYMQNKVGEEYSGIITSVTSFGLFVMLDDIYVDGLVHITALDRDYFHFDPVGHRLTGDRTGITYRLGDPLKIRVAAVNIEDRKIDFVLAESASKAKGEGKAGQQPKKRKPRSRSRSRKEEDRGEPSKKKSASRGRSRSRSKRRT
ncbi:MAG: ribonuclease R [Gammaproteobacteria bacterium]